MRDVLELIEIVRQIADERQRRRLLHVLGRGSGARRDAERAGTLLGKLAFVGAPGLIGELGPDVIASPGDLIARQLKLREGEIAQRLAVGAEADVCVLPE